MNGQLWIRIMKTIKSSEITPENIYLNRRDFLKSLGIVSASAVVLAACGGQPGSTSQPTQVESIKTAVSGELVEISKVIDLERRIRMAATRKRG